MSNQPNPHARSVFPHPGQSRPPAPHQVARALYGSAFDALNREAVEQSMLDFRKLHQKDQLFIVGHLLYLKLQAEAATQRALIGLRETLNHIAGATYTIADEVTRPRLEEEYDAAMTQQAEGALAAALSLAEDATTSPEEGTLAGIPGAGPAGTHVLTPTETDELEDLESTGPEAMADEEEDDSDVQP